MIDRAKIALMIKPNPPVTVCYEIMVVGSRYRNIRLRIKRDGSISLNENRIECGV